MSKSLVVALRSVNPRVVLSGLALITISVIAASCSNDVTGPVETPLTPPKEILSTLFCKATPSTQTLSCSETPDALGNVLPSYMLGVGSDGLAVQKIIIGGQNTNITLTSSNIVNNTTTHDFSFDVNVKNLRPQAIGTSNGTTTDSSLAVFFYSGPTTTGGSGSTNVSNPSGVTAFTGPNQPYFRYNEMVAQNATSSNKNWILHYDPTVTSFSFLLLVSANVKYPEGYIDVAPNPGGVSVSSTLQMTDSVRDALGYARADQTETWSLSDSTRASINSSGLLTGLANGTVVVTATQGQAFGSATITVSGGVTPTAVVDSSAANSAPGSPYHTAFNTQYVLAAPGVLSNDTPGNPAGTVSTFGADSLGGAVTDHDAGSTVSPLPGHADGSLTVGANGAVTFTPPTDFTGYYAFHYRNTNSSGSTSALVRIAVGIRASASASSYAPHLLGNVGVNTSTSTNTKVNAAGDAIAYHFVSSTNGTANVHSDGTYDFNPNVGYTGTASLTYNVSNGFGTTANATVSLTVDAPRIWFVAPGGTGDGRYGSPLGCIVGPVGCFSNTANVAGDVLHLASGTYTDSSWLTVKNNQRVIGQGAPGVFSDAANANVTWPADAGAQPALGGARPKINSNDAYVFILQSGNTLRGLVSGNAVLTSVLGSSIGTFTMNNGAIANTIGGALDLSISGTLAVALDSLTGRTGNNGIVVSLSNQSGTLTSNLTRATAITSATGIYVNNSAGFSFGDTRVKMQVGNGVQLTNNTGTTSFASLVDSTINGQALVVSSGGTVAVGGGVLYAQGVSALNATNTAFSGAGFSSTTASLLLQPAVSLNGVSGTLALGSGSIESTTDAFKITGNSSGTVSYSGTIANSPRPVNISNASAGSCPSVTLSGNISSVSNGILVQNCNSGTILFSGASKLLKTTTNKGVQLASNTGATINFTNGGLVDSTTTGSAFEATGGGTVSVTGTGNILRSTTGTPLTVTATTIGGGGITFQSVSSNGAVNGINLNNTGSTGGLSVTGTGSAGTGGSILNSTADGVLLVQTTNPALAWMTINDSNDSGISIDAVSGLNLGNLVLNSNGVDSENGVVQDDNIHIEDLIGTSNTISNSTITDARNSNLDWDPNSSSGMSTLTVTNTKMNHAGGGVSSQGNAGINLTATGTANVKLIVTGGQVINNAAAGILITSQPGSTVRSDLSGIDMVSSAPPVDPSGATWGNGVGTNFGISIGTSGNGVGIHKINNVSVAYTGIGPNDGGSGSAISFVPTGTGTFDITITNNTIGTASGVRSGNENFFGIAGDIRDSPNVRANITGNTVRHTAANGIFVQARDPNAAAGNSNTDLTIRNNIVGSIDDDDDFPYGNGPGQTETHAIRIESRNDSNLRLDIAGNSADGIASNEDYLLRQRDTSLFSLERLGSSTAVDATVAAFITNQNPTPSGQVARITHTVQYTAIPDNTVVDPTLP
jgi:hypothetical protein